MVGGFPEHDSNGTATEAMGGEDLNFPHGSGQPQSTIHEMWMGWVSTGKVASNVGHRGHRWPRSYVGECLLCDSRSINVLIASRPPAALTEIQGPTIFDRFLFSSNAVNNKNREPSRRHKRKYNPGRNWNKIEYHTALVKHAPCGGPGASKYGRLLGAMCALHGRQGPGGIQDSVLFATTPEISRTNILRG